MSARSVQAAATPPVFLLGLLVCGLQAVSAFNVLSEGALVFSAPGRPSLGDYFGYSVTLATIQGRDWMMVAAPRANSSFDVGFSRSGALFQCLPTGGSCVEVGLEQGSSDTGEENPLHINNGSLGGSMDALLGSDGMVVCNPLFKQQERSTNILDVPGICYWIFYYGDSLRKIKLTSKVLPEQHCIINKEDFKDGHGTPQMGFSVHQLKEEGQHLLIGGPGLYDGRGTVALYLYNIQEHEQQEKYGVAIPLMTNDSYFGYSVTAGKFRPAGVLYVGSAPRAEDLLGKVIVFSYNTQFSCLRPSPPPVTTVIIEKELNGEQLGEYFGASLAVADINGDGIDELLVGAPLHSSKLGDEGKVYLYMSSGRNNTEMLDIKEEIVPRVKMPGARFGTSIASLGDIDKDGYSDVAIGAPYENSEKGAIYIFYGSPETPFLKYEKHIRASDINNGLVGFGFSFSRGADIDKNTYNDVAVGSYLSGNAVMLRTSPVLRFNSSVEIRENRIPMNASSLDLYVCVRANELLEDTGVKVTMNIDPVYSRGYINEMRKYKYDLYMTPRNLKDECQSIQITLKDKKKPSFKPFEIELSYNITYPIMKNGNFCKTCPVLDIKSQKTSHYLHYQTGCAGQICKTDLTLKGNFTDVRSPFVIGSNNKSSIEMIVEVANLMESSYETNVTIKFPSAIKLRQLHQSCYKVKTDSKDLTNLICEVPDLLSQYSKPFIFNIQFDMDNVPWDINLLQVNISVEGSGDEQHTADDRLLLSLELQHIANISIKGRSSADHMPFATKINGTEDYEFHDVTFEHSYIISNDGPSPVHGLDLKFMFPYKLKSAESDQPYLFVRPASTRFLQNVLKSQEERFSDEDVGPQRSRYPQYLNLDCSFPEVECQEIYYNTSNTLRAKQGITLSFQITSPLRELGPLIMESGIYLRSTGAIENEYILKQETVDKKYFTAEAEIKLSGIVVSQANVQEWIIIVAIICGIIILAIICIVLWKMGFFKRNKLPPPEEEEEDEESAKPETVEKVDTDPLCDSNA